ncbi:hypothetical protein DAPPUDRAFT_101797 [Daphnia pulex]|uniref:Uncharacterized protein n=1 Tax=Daphnia pulex TaxID=6669 RepID=E9GEL0_DAPPU|nr:hypothetical protein DAPPUDRAFT_101797 [Daphnia pulex]|eukprot:EFX82294.1 hypothetical protein DAPPUDRAFT_101797 [Daphnia pulex]
MEKPNDGLREAYSKFENYRPKQDTVGCYTETNGSIEVCKLYDLAPLQHLKRGNTVKAVKLPCKENPKLPISSTMCANIFKSRNTTANNGGKTEAGFTETRARKSCAILIFINGEIGFRWPFDV